jgi:hypothetical protein
MFQLTSNNSSSNPATNADILRNLGIANRAGVSVVEFARFFNRGRGWGYRRIRKGDVQAIDTLGNLMIPVSEVIRLANGGK